MLTQVDATSSQGALLSLPLDDISEGFIIESIDGLDPVDATLVSSSYAEQDGEQYQAASRGKRNIVLKLGLEPDYSVQTVRQLRDRLYSFFMPKSPVSLKFIHDAEATVDIAGRVESFSAPLFVQDPVATISIINFLPDFIDLTPRTITGHSVTDITEQLVEYSGTVETGFVFRMTLLNDITEFTLLIRSSDGQQRAMYFSANFKAGDSVRVSTVSGSKGVYVVRNAIESSYLYALAPYSNWINFFPGDNYIRLSVAGAPVTFTMDYTDKYGGI